MVLSSQMQTVVTTTSTARMRVDNGLRNRIMLLTRNRTFLSLQMLPITLSSLPSGRRVRAPKK